MTIATVQPAALPTNGEALTRTSRNRLNSRLSTGPRTAVGKDASRRNALSHGLTANPAAGVTESPGAFQTLFDSVANRLQPQDVVEAVLVHRIAIALWRLQRAARIDAAACTLADAVATPDRETIQGWIYQIGYFWRTQLVERADPSDLGVESGGLKSKPRMRHRYLRPSLWTFDSFVERDVMPNGYAITAMLVMLDECLDALKRIRVNISLEQAEQLAWLLGDRTEMFPEDADEAWKLLRHHAPTEAQRMVVEAMDRPCGTELPGALLGLAAARRNTLRQQRRVCAVRVDARSMRPNEQWLCFRTRISWTGSPVTKHTQSGHWFGAWKRWPSCGGRRSRRFGRPSSTSRQMDQL